MYVCVSAVCSSSFRCGRCVRCGGIPCVPTAARVWCGAYTVCIPPVEAVPDRLVLHRLTLGECGGRCSACFEVLHFLLCLTTQFYPGVCAVFAACQWAAGGCTVRAATACPATAVWASVSATNTNFVPLLLAAGCRRFSATGCAGVLVPALRSAQSPGVFCRPAQPRTCLLLWLLGFGVPAYCFAAF